jgi:arylsulfatase
MQAAGLLAGSMSAPARAAGRPNFIVVYCDDLGYGDIGCYGSPIRTPNLDRMAAEGTRFTSCVTANPICSPSRAGLLTGRYPTRVGVPRVFFPKDTTGMNLDEQTLPQQLKQAGYRTACIGKWHLGRPPAYLPTARGFDSYFGIPYSNDMKPAVLLRNTEIVEPEADQTTLTPRYTAEALRFVESARGEPFFLYLAHTYPHIPLHASPRFRGKSPLGLYGDVIEELDWSMGEVLNRLRATHLDRDTLVLFSSDNGPWFQGSPGRLRGRKGTSNEGGVRVPFIAWWPGRVPNGRTSDAFVSTMDFMPTLLSLAGAPRPAKSMDGVDIWDVLAGQRAEAPRDVFLYFDDWNLQCARVGKWKLHVARYNTPPYVAAPPAGRLNLPLREPELYNMELDLDESYDQAAEHPEIVRDILQRIQALVPSFPEPVRKAWEETRKRPATSWGAGSHPFSGKLQQD